ncbi:hypothetical protein DVJ78_11735 [Humibacter sp. BT305]|nr:hypothetical protein DVJ78_11735 [Humibacter sp. BT305]
MRAERSIRVSRIVALFAAWLSLACVGGPVLAVMVQVLGLFLWPDDGLSDDYDVAVTAIVVLPRVALVGVPMGMLAVVLGVLELRKGRNSTPLAVGLVGLALCALVGLLGWGLWSATGPI